MSGGHPNAERLAVSGRRRIVLATGNRSKAREIQAMLGDAWEILLQSDCGVTPIPETGATFVENALLKARHAAVVTGLAALGDDSGLEVAALGGAPGLRSARYAGPDASDADNLKQLLSELAFLPAGRRAARFRCALAFVNGPDDPDPVIAEGIWEGRITNQPRGTGGFGYDPVFEDPPSGLTAAELPAGVKNERSHRGQAVRLLRLRLAVVPG